MMVVVAGMFALPLFHSPSAQLLPRDLLKSVTSAVAVVLGATGVVVIGGGLVLVGEKAWWKVKSWMQEQRRRLRDGDE